MKNLYPSQLIRRTVGKSRFLAASNYVDCFREEADSKIIEQQQLRLFNDAWTRARKLPFYSEWARIHSLPERISSLKDLAFWPVLTKGDLRSHLALVQKTPGIIGSYRTSGSTGEPFDFPKGEGETDENYATMWAYRRANGLQPFDPFLLVANMSTGSAQSRWTQLRQRSIRAGKDLLGNSWKTDGFVPTHREADRGLQLMKLQDSKYVIGYPSGISALARRAQELNLQLPNLTHAILTSESIDTSDIALIENALKVKVLIEYGAVELGVVAGSSPHQGSWPLKVNWWSHLVRLQEDRSALITTLLDRTFPLIHYGIGDIIQPKIESPGGSVLQIEYVEGRTRDFVNIGTRNGGHLRVSARDLTTLVRDHPSVTSIQVAQRDSESVELYIVAPSANRSSLVSQLTSSFMRNRKDFKPNSVSATFINHHIPSARGKRGVLIDYNEAPQGSESFSLIPS